MSKTLAFLVVLFTGTAAFAADPTGYVNGQTPNQITQVRKVQQGDRTVYVVTYWPGGRTETTDKEPAGTVWR